MQKMGNYDLASTQYRAAGAAVAGLEKYDPKELNNLAKSLLGACELIRCLDGMDAMAIKLRLER